MGRIEFVLGGIRSGKSRFAEERARRWQQETSGAVTYLATSRIRDNEMQARVARHRSRRPASWNTVERARRVAQSIRDSVDESSLVLLDCVNMLVSNVLLDLEDQQPREAAMDRALAEVDELAAALRDRSGPSILISNEVGMAPVALTPLGRLFQDTIGIAHQRIASVSDSAFFLVAGMPQQLK
jgi:adenosylcobinamide kinase/adenosylcobinamide-phosphate guanylyltransferase